MSGGGEYERGRNIGQRRLESKQTTIKNVLAHLSIYIGSPHEDAPERGKCSSGVWTTNNILCDKNNY
jgi:hypothetical protein